ncbi:MAG TPA: YCF48-related protein [Nevskiaceae bacterium]|nr:YCF48-related protein [Nevskiaceae bacterium]
MTMLVTATVMAQEEAPPEAPPPAGPHPALPAPKAAQDRLLDIAVAGSRLVAVGQQGVILTSDDGKTWAQSEAPVGVMLTRVKFADASHGWALGYDATVLETTDAGKTWAVRHYDPEARALFDVLFLDAQHAIAVGAYGTHLESTDGGRTWTPKTSVLSDAGAHLNAILKLGDGTLFVAGERGLLARSADAGATWSLLDSPYAGSLFGALPRGDKGVLVFGMRGHVYVASDVAACPTVDAATWDPYARETVTDPARLTALGWRPIEAPVRESLFGALTAPSGATLLVGINGTMMTLDKDAAALALAKGPARETIVKAAAFNGRAIAVGRRGAQDVGALP